MSAVETPPPSWWGKIDALPPATQERVVEAFTPRIRLRYTSFTPTAKQAVFLALQGREAFYGGAAGPGKSTALMMAALQYVDVPGYRALLLRRTFAELERGGLIDMSREMIGESDARYNENKKRWTFPSGATLTFGHMQYENDKYKYQGAPYHFVGWDELTHFTETMYEYLFSRSRRPAAALGMGAAPDGLTAATVPIRMRSASNPGGHGHDWVKARFVNPLTRKPGRVFVPALMTENPHLDIASYLEALSELRGAERLRLAAGDWDAKDDGDFFNRGTWTGHDAWSFGTRAVRAWDMAGTKPSPANPDPDYTVGQRVEIDHRSGEFCVQHVARDRVSAAGVEEMVRETARDDGRDVVIRLEQEPGSAGKAVVDRFRRHILRGYVVRAVRPTGAKHDRVKPASAAAEQGLYHFVYADWNADYFAELEAFTADDTHGHDDQVDTLSSAHEELTRSAPAKIGIASSRRIAGAGRGPVVRVPRVSRRPT